MQRDGLTEAIVAFLRRQGIDQDNRLRLENLGWLLEQPEVYNAVADMLRKRDLLHDDLCLQADFIPDEYMTTGGGVSSEEVEVSAPDEEEPVSIADDDGIYLEPEEPVQEETASGDEELISISDEDSEQWPVLTEEGQDRFDPSSAGEDGEGEISLDEIDAEFEIVDDMDLAPQADERPLGEILDEIYAAEGEGTDAADDASTDLPAEPEAPEDPPRKRRPIGGILAGLASLRPLLRRKARRAR